MLKQTVQRSRIHSYHLCHSVIGNAHWNSQYIWQECGGYACYAWWNMTREDGKIGWRGWDWEGVQSGSVHGEQGAHYRVCRVALPNPPRRQALPIVQPRPQWGSGRSHSSSSDDHRVPRRQPDCTRHHAAGSILNMSQVLSHLKNYRFVSFDSFMYGVWPYC